MAIEANRRHYRKVAEGALMFQAPHRIAAAAVLAVAAFGLTAIPAAADKPSRVVIVPDQGFVIPAGIACPFAVSAEPSEKGQQAFTEFSDGRLVTNGWGQPTLTNLDTGASIIHVSAYKVTEIYDSESDEVHVQTSGKIFILLFPGDQGPFGPVGGDGGLFSMTGRHTLIADASTGAVTSFVAEGTATNLCTELSA